MIPETQLKVYLDVDGHSHYDFTIAKEHMQGLKVGAGWNETLQASWIAIQSLPDENFFKKAFAFTILIRALYNATLEVSEAAESELI